MSDTKEEIDVKRSKLDTVIGGFWKNDNGSATIEAVLWIPIFVLFMTMVADASFLFFGQNQAYRVVQDANRSLSVGRLATEDDVETFITSALGSLAPNAVATTVINNGSVTSVVQIPATDLIAIGAFSALVNADLTIASRHLVEY